MGQPAPLGCVQRLARDREDAGYMLAGALQPGGGGAAFPLLLDGWISSAGNSQVRKLCYSCHVGSSGGQTVDKAAGY